ELGAHQARAPPHSLAAYVMLPAFVTVAACARLAAYVTVAACCARVAAYVTVAPSLMEDRLMRRILAVILALGAGALLLDVASASAEARVKVGALKLTSSAPLFIGVEKGFFKEFGVDPELVYFQAAAPIATALAAGQLDVGATGLTAALYNIVLGGEQLWIVADKGREWPGYPLVAIVVQKELWDSGLRSVKDLRGRRIGVTQLGSTFHF